jgi:outer membrane protein OmpA-like peptidoglycan-associated protein
MQVNVAACGGSGPISAQFRTWVNAASRSAPSFTPVRTNILQRKCACGGAPGLDGECAECRRKRLTLQRRSTDHDGPSTVPLIVNEALRSPGQPLNPNTRAFMESRFGHDFGQVRVHDDTRAAESARAVNALAYTVGRDIVFGAGQYTSRAGEGCKLIAHELAHVVQQEDGDSLAHRDLKVGPVDDAYEREAERVAGQIAVGSERAEAPLTRAQPHVQRVCGPFPPGTVSSCTGLTGDVVGEPFFFNVRCDDFQPGEEARLSAFAATLTSSDILEIHGFASEEGAPELNEHLSCLRAEKAYLVLTSAGVPSSQINTELFMHGATAGPRPERRSVVIDVSTVATPPAAVCDPATFTVASTLAQYVDLVRCAERALPGLSSREMLSLLRKLYYSSESWSRCAGAGCAFWSDVIPCELSITDPRPGLGTPLYNALRNSQVVAGTDTGHVFTGLEAMTCPRSDVELNVPGPNWIVNIPNEEFATWGGDLGSAAAQKVHDEQDLGLIPRPWSAYVGTSKTLAGSEDMEGNIDSYAIRKGLTGPGCGTSAATPITTISAPVSQLLDEYYTGAATAVGGTRADRFACFAQALGGVVAGRTITNKSALVTPVSRRVNAFASDFYRLKWHHGYFAPTGIGAWLLRYSIEVTEEFLNWLETKL